MRKYIISLMLLLILVFAFNSMAFAQNEVAVDTWKVHFLNSVTGPIASIGEYMSWSAKYAANEINENGGIRGKPVEIVIHDTGVKPDKGIEEMSKIVDDALVAMGPVPEAVIMAAVPVAAQNGLFCMTSSTSYEYTVEYFPWTLSWYPPTDEKLPPITEMWAEQNPEMKKVVQFVEKWAAWPGMADAHKIGLNNENVEVVDVEVPKDSVDFNSLIVKALSEDPDGILLTCNPDKAGKIIKGLVNRGWEKKDNILVFSSADDTALYTTGGDALEGISIYNYIDPNSENQRWLDFKKEYKEDHDGKDPGSLATNYYDSVYMIKEAIENKKITGDPAKLEEERKMIRDYCRNVDNFEGIQVTWSMNEGVPTSKPIFLFEIVDGEKKLIGQSN
ncbi:MAG: ABC transporter substrate-binding protein [Halanaerobiales bacterium]|nr:ABC transporter substrate-binding protein [Halanaerobiales bacterium]